MTSSDSARVPIAASAPQARVDDHEKQLEALNELTRIANLDLELRPMLQRITDALARHFEWPFVTLIVVDQEAGTFTCLAVTSSVPTHMHVGYSGLLGSGVVGEVAATQKPVLVEDVRKHPNFVDATPGVMSEICVPVVHKSELAAVLDIENTRLGAFNGQLPLLQAIAEQIAGAIAGAQMYEELRQRARLMEMMAEVSREALGATNLDGFLRNVAAYVHAHFALEIVSIRLYDREAGEYVRAADAGTPAERTGNRWPINEGIIGRCLRTNQTQLVLDVNADPEYIRSDSNVVAELVVPIRFRDELLGVFNLESRSADVFTPASILAFEAFADQIAGALRLVRTNDALSAANAEVEQQRMNLQASNERLTGLVEKFEQMSAHDSLTGLYNRLHFDKTFPVEWRRASRARVPLSLLIADIDSFKAFNDARGHRAGDECLKFVAHAIQATVHRAGEIVARYGGEEFAILLPLTDLEGARKLAETIRQRVAKLAIDHPLSETGDRLTISIGVASCVPDGDERHAQGLVDAADKALYKAKRAGRNRVVCQD